MAKQVRTITSLREIDHALWNACANPPGESFNPFVDYAFFRALEDSGSAVRKTGWLAQHLILEDDMQRVLGVLPCYLKSHSQGEYVFDYGWAEAYQRAGGRYYPKLQVSVPFTPVAGPRLLVPAGSLATTSRLLLLSAVRELCREHRASSVHVTFPNEREWQFLGEQGFLGRTDTQFHWLNQGFGSFEEFLQQLSSAKRKNIRKERQAVKEAGIALEWLTGNDIREQHWDAFFDFYMETGSRKWGRPYLTRSFFSLIGAAMAQHILLVMCRRGRRIIGGALNFIGSDALYGRNWGASEHHAYLHFEACYYQAIDFAIARKLARVEAGAQGPHKLSRGYLPRTTYSAHYFADERLGLAVARYLEHERVAVAEDQSDFAAHTPFRRQA
jgi:uncharacterized protein